MISSVISLRTFSKWETNLKSTKKNYDQAMNKLSEGKGNLIRRTEVLKELGAKATKSVDSRLIDRGGD